RVYSPKRSTTPSSSGSTRKKPEKPHTTTAASAISRTPRPPRLPPGNTLFSLSWLRRSNSSRSGGVGPDDCGPDPHGPLEPPEPHGPPPWLLHGMKSLLPGESERFRAFLSRGLYGTAFSLSTHALPCGAASR